MYKMIDNYHNKTKEVDFDEIIDEADNYICLFLIPEDENDLDPDYPDEAKQIRDEIEYYETVDRNIYDETIDKEKRLNLANDILNLVDIELHKINKVDNEVHKINQ